MSDCRDVKSNELSEALGRRGISWRGADVRSRQRSAYPRSKTEAVYTKAFGSAPRGK